MLDYATGWYVKKSMSQQKVPIWAQLRVWAEKGKDRMRKEEEVSADREAEE